MARSSPLDHRPRVLRFAGGAQVGSPGGDVDVESSGNLLRVAESLREHANWRTIIDYWAWILTACVGIGGALRASGQFWAAAAFFAVAGLSAVCKSVQVAVDAKEDKLSHRISG